MPAIHTWSVGHAKADGASTISNQQSRSRNVLVDGGIGLDRVDAARGAVNWTFCGPGGLQRNFRGDVQTTATCRVRCIRPPEGEVTNQGRECWRPGASARGPSLD